MQQAGLSCFKLHLKTIKCNIYMYEYKYAFMLRLRNKLTFAKQSGSYLVLEMTKCNTCRSLCSY